MPSKIPQIIYEHFVAVALAIAIGILILLSSSCPLLAQLPERADYSLFRETASSTSDAVTIQIPTSGRSATIINLQVQCISATATDVCDVEFQKGGTDASATALTVNRMNSKARTATTTGFHTSDAGAGTTVNKVQQAVNVPFPYLSGYVLAGAGDKLTIRISSAGNQKYRWYVEWDEN